jgi:hypothetical protein
VVQDFGAFSAFVTKTTQPYKLNDQYLNGPQLAAFIRQTVGEVNAGTPVIPSALQRLAMQRNSQLMKMCVEEYEKKMSGTRVTESMKALKDTHITALSRAKEALASVRSHELLQTLV